MKKLILPLLVLVLLAGLDLKESKAQANWEVGVRFWDNTSIEATIPVGTSPRLLAAVYLERFGIGGYFDWMFALNGGPTGLKFYPGIGPEFFFENRFDFNLAGNLGVEYSFNFPITIGFDYRPGIRFTNGVDYVDTWGLFARFRFGEGTSFKRTN